METNTIDRPTAWMDARKSEVGTPMTEAEFDEAWDIAGILHREIHRSGSFFRKLEAYTRTYAGRDKINASREETILRDIYAARYGETLNETRERLLKAEEDLRQSGDNIALKMAYTIPALIEDNKLPFYLAPDQAARSFAYQRGISESGAKKMMAEAFEQSQDRSLYEYGKELEAKYAAPVRKADHDAKTVERRERARSGPSR